MECVRGHWGCWGSPARHGCEVMTAEALEAVSAEAQDGRRSFGRAVFSSPLLCHHKEVEYVMFNKEMGHFSLQIPSQS